MFCHRNPLACGTARGLCHAGSKMHLLEQPLLWVLSCICSLLFHYTWIKHRESYLQLSGIATHSAERDFSWSCELEQLEWCVCECFLAALSLQCPWCHPVGLAPCRSVRLAPSWAVPVLCCLTAIDKNRLRVILSYCWKGGEALWVPWKAFWLEHTFAYLLRHFDCHGAWQL